MIMIEEHASRGDFSRWIREVLGDQTLAVAIANLEEKYRHARVGNLPNEIARRIRERYELGS